LLAKKTTNDENYSLKNYSAKNEGKNIKVVRNVGSGSVVGEYFAPPWVGTQSGRGTINRQTYRAHLLRQSGENLYPE